MSFSFKIGFFSFLLLAVHLQHCNQTTHATKEEHIEVSVDSTNAITSVDTEAFEANSNVTRTVLITHCGSCHQSTLPTQKAGAIAVFDLDKNDAWHEDLLEEHLEGIGNRLLNKSDITETQKEAIRVFIELKALQLEHKP
ncbi:MAG: hypothetical protein HKP00_12220 [Flavobacteriaceae bacterium]|nr:hypothetical protein [Flavobacteriaceae bacterium]